MRIISIKDDYLQEPSFCFLAPSYLVYVRQVKRLLALIEVDEVSHIEQAQIVHDLPGIILRYLYLEQVHIL